MKDYITKYLYNDSYMKKFLSDTQYMGIDKETPSFFRANDVTILPTKKDPDLFWGRGGAITNEGKFIEASRVGDAFGGYYDFEKEKVPFYRETVIYIPVIPNHWGHFLLDCLCRFWFINDDKYKDYRIAFCGYNWSNNQVEGKYLELLHLMGIDDSRLIYIKEPCSFACVLIPEPTLGYTIANSSYRNIIDTIIANVYKSEIIKNLQPYEKIYFSRAHFWRSSIREVGEKEIENQFAINGFKILSPEQLNVYEQIFYINNAKIMACTNGTLPHNSIFRGKHDFELIILAKTPVINPPQFVIDDLFDINSVYIDSFQKIMNYYAPTYGEDPFWLSDNNNLEKFFLDRGYIFEKKGKFTYFAVTCKQFFRFEYLLVRKKLSKNKCLKALRNIIYRGC